MLDVREMSQQDQAIVRAMIEECARQICSEPDYRARLGVSHNESADVLANWPPPDETDLATMLTINNSMNEMCHGIRFRDGWPEYLPCSRERAKDVFEMWRGQERWKDR